MELNGFKISKYNVHGFKENAKQSTCPLCSESRKKKTDKCVSLHWDSGLAKCHHCGEIIQMHEYEKKQVEIKYKIPEWNNDTKLSDGAVKWFEGRKISQFILRLMKIGEGVESMPDAKGWKNKNTVQFPYIRRGEVIDVKYRSGDKAFKLYKEAERIPYNLDNVAGNEIIYLVEGEMDVLAVMECGIHNVTSPPNGFTEKGTVNLDFLNNDVDVFLNAEKLILAFDNDEPGENGKREFIRRFGAHKCFTVDLKDCKDSNEYSIKYGVESLKEALENHIEIPLEDISTYSDYKNRVRDFFLNGMPKGIMTKTLANLDEYFSTYFSQLLLVTGIPSSGKSEVVDQMVISYAVNYGHKTAFCSVENKPNELHHQKLIRKLLGYTPKKRIDFNSSFEACEKFTDDHFYMIDLENGYDLDRVLSKAEELVYRKGIKILVIDPFNKIKLKSKIESVTGNRTNDYTNAYLEKLNEFATKFDVLIILVAHPVKMHKQENGKRAVPDFYDVKGGGEFYDMCHHGIVVHRDYDLDLVLIKTLKVKFAHLGENNKETWFKYNINNGRLGNVIGNPNGTEAYNIDWDNDNWVVKQINDTPQNKLELDEFNVGSFEDEVPF